MKDLSSKHDLYEIVLSYSCSLDGIHTDTAEHEKAQQQKRAIGKCRSNKKSRNQAQSGSHAETNPITHLRSRVHQLNPMRGNESRTGFRARPHRS